MIEDKSIESILNSINNLNNRISKLEKDSHPPRDFVLCNYCRNKIKEYEDVLEHFRRFSSPKATHLKSSRLDEICKDRDAAMERLSIKLFGRIYAKQEQN